RILDREDLDVVASHGDGRLLGADLGRLERAVDAVVLENVGEGLCVGQVVDGDDFDVGHFAFDERTHDAATDSTESIYTYLGDHDESSGGGVIRRLQPFSGQAPLQWTFRARSTLRNRLDTLLVLRHLSFGPRISVLPDGRTERRFE